jgi:hypothetical protein
MTEQGFSSSHVLQDISVFPSETNTMQCHTYSTRMDIFLPFHPPPHDNETENTNRIFLMAKYLHWLLHNELIIQYNSIGNIFPKTDYFFSWLTKHPVYYRPLTAMLVPTIMWLDPEWLPNVECGRFANTEPMTMWQTKIEKSSKLIEHKAFKNLANKGGQK